MDVFVALITAAIGLLALLFGYRIFKLLLPLLGFFVGLVVGAFVKVFKFKAVHPENQAKAGVSTKPMDGALIDLELR